MAGEDELKKLEELFSMGFVGQDEYKKRREEILANSALLPSSSSSSPPNPSVIAPTPILDLTTEDETSEELIKLYASFVELSSKAPYSYIISVHDALDDLTPSEHTSYLHVPKDCLAWLLNKQQIPEEEISWITDACSSYPDKLCFAFSDLNSLDFNAELYVTRPYQTGEVVSHNVVVHPHLTKLNPNYFPMLDIGEFKSQRTVRIRLGRLEVMYSTVAVHKGEAVSEEVRLLLATLGIGRTYKNEMIFAIENGVYIPARYTMSHWDNPFIEAALNVSALGNELHYPLETAAPAAIRNAFFDVLGFSAGLSDEFVIENLDQTYVDTCTGYYINVRNEIAKQKELEELETNKKVEIQALESDISAIKEAMEAFEHEYKDMKANFEDQDFKFSGMQVTTTPYVEQVLVAPGHLKRIPILVEIKIGQQPEVLERVPFNLAIVLDRSGSMQGEKLTNCKRAIHDIIDKMKAEDMLHLIIYDDQVNVEFTDCSSSDQATMRAKVEKVWARNNTNISEAMQKTTSVFRNSKSSFHKRAFLFSDGQANAGYRDPRELSHLASTLKEEHNIITSTFGIGEDFNYEIMDGIAKKGHGTYFFIDHGHNIPKLVDKGLRGLTSLLATDAFLRIKPANKGIKIAKVYGHNILDNIPVGDLRYGDLKQILVDVVIDPEHFQVGSQTIVEFELDFNSQEKDSGTTFLPASGIQVPLLVTFSSDSQAVASQEINHEVEVTKVIKESADLDSFALNMFKAGDIEKAVESKRKKIADLMRVSLHDRYGFTKVLLQKARKSLLEFLQANLRKKISDYNDALYNINRKFTKEKPREMYHSANAGAAKSAELFKKELEYEAMEEECDDMGFGLFD